MNQITENGRRARLRVLPAGREPRRRTLALLAKTDRRTADALVRELEPFIGWVAGKQLGLGVSQDELVQMGRVGVLGAIQSYKPRKGASFEAYAYWWIHGAMRRGIAWQRRTIRVPEKRFQLAGKMRKVRSGS